MRNNLFFALWGFVLILTGCQVSGKQSTSPGSNIVTVVGAIHGGHRNSKDYSLSILRSAIVKFEPDIILVELPPDRFQQASDNFAQYGQVRESRADDFPELTDVVFPLRQELGFTMVPVAAWTEEIANNRRAAMRRLETDPFRTKDWTKYQSAIRKYNRIVSGKSSDPDFIHSQAYDQAVKARQETLERLFGKDLGAGGWQNINMAHLALINTALDDLRGQGKRVLILYGAWHKYKILKGLEDRTDIKTVDASDLF